MSTVLDQLNAFNTKRASGGYFNTPDPSPISANPIFAPAPKMLDPATLDTSNQLSPSAPKQNQLPAQPGVSIPGEFAQVLQGGMYGLSTAQAFQKWSQGLTPGQIQQVKQQTPLGGNPVGGGGSYGGGYPIPSSPGLYIGFNNPGAAPLTGAATGYMGGAPPGAPSVDPQVIKDASDKAYITNQTKQLNDLVASGHGQSNQAAGLQADISGQNVFSPIGKPLNWRGFQISGGDQMGIGFRQGGVTDPQALSFADWHDAVVRSKGIYLGATLGLGGIPSGNDIGTPEGEAPGAFNPTPWLTPGSESNPLFQDTLPPPSPEPSASFNPKYGQGWAPANAQPASANIVAPNSQPIDTESGMPVRPKGWINPIYDNNTPSDWSNEKPPVPDYLLNPETGSNYPANSFPPPASYYNNGVNPLYYSPNRSGTGGDSIFPSGTLFPNR